MRVEILAGKLKNCNGFFTGCGDGYLKPNPGRTWFGAICGVGASKSKIAKGFSKPNSEPGPND